MAAQDSPPRTQFADLVRARRTELRLSYARLEQQAVDPETGTRVKGSWVHRLETNEPVIPPQLPQLNALAIGLELPLGQLQDAAAAQFFGVDTVWSSSGEAAAIVRHVERLNPDQRAQLKRLLDTFVPPVGE